jgi:hypothetical protein
MRRKFKLIDAKGQHLAVVLYFHEEQINSNVGIIFKSDLSTNSTWLYKDEPIKEVIADLVSKLEIEYESFEEVN